MTPPKLLRTVREAHAFEREAHRRGQRLALVPTMGALHEGHLQLMREGKTRAEVTVASVFVNPTQFGPQEDFAQYPRDLEGDAAKCAGAGVDVVFAPDVSEMYPPGEQTIVEVTGVSARLEGVKRPGHFRGVATVVTKLLAAFRPDVALFGEKDFQQLQVIRALARDLLLGVEIVGVPTVRERDGLAMSSRNAYLSPDERRRALSLSQGLFSAQAAARAGERDASKLVDLVRRALSSADAREDYVELVDAATLEPMARLRADQPARLLVAAFVGRTRLIDNVAL